MALPVEIPVKPHPVALAKTVPMRSVLVRAIDGSSKTRAEQAGGQAFRSDRALRKPFKALPAGDRLIGTGGGAVVLQVLLGNRLA